MYWLFAYCKTIFIISLIVFNSTICVLKKQPVLDRLLPQSNIISPKWRTENQYLKCTFKRNAIGRTFIWSCNIWQICNQIFDFEYVTRLITISLKELCTNYQSWDKDDTSVNWTDLVRSVYPKISSKLSLDWFISPLKVQITLASLEIQNSV